MENNIVQNSWYCPFIGDLAVKLRNLKAASSISTLSVLVTDDVNKQAIYLYLRDVNHNNYLEIKDYSKIMVLIIMNEEMEKDDPFFFHYLPIRLPNIRKPQYDGNLFTNNLNALFPYFEDMGLDNNMSAFLGCTPNCVSSGGLHIHRERYLTLKQLSRLVYYYNNGIRLKSQIWHTLTDVGFKNTFIDKLHLQEGRQNYTVYEILPKLTLLELCLAKVVQTPELKNKLMNLSHLSYKICLAAVSGIVLLSGGSDYYNIAKPLSVIGILCNQDSSFSPIVVNFGSLPISCINNFPFFSFWPRLVTQGMIVDSPISVFVKTGGRMDYVPQLTSKQIVLPDGFRILQREEVRALCYNQSSIGPDSRRFQDWNKTPPTISERLSITTLIDKGWGKFECDYTVNKYLDSPKHRVIAIMNSTRGSKHRAYFGCIFTNFNMRYYDETKFDLNFCEVILNVYFWDGEKVKNEHYGSYSNFATNFGVEPAAWGKDYIMLRSRWGFVDIRSSFPLFRHESSIRTSPHIRLSSQVNKFLYTQKRIVQLLKPMSDPKAKLLLKILMRNIMVMEPCTFRNEVFQIHMMEDITYDISGNVPKLIMAEKENQLFDQELDRILGPFEDEEITVLSSIRLERFDDMIHYNSIWDGEHILSYVGGSIDCTDNNDIRPEIAKLIGLSDYYDNICGAVLDQRWDEEEELLSYYNGGVGIIDSYYTQNGVTDSDISDSDTDVFNYDDDRYDREDNEDTDGVSRYDYL